MRIRLITAALLMASALAPVPAAAAMYTISLTGNIADAQYATSNELSFGTINLLADLFPTFEVGDVVTYRLMLDQLFTVPSATEQFFSVDLPGSPVDFDNDMPGDDAADNISVDGSLTLLDGTLAGSIFNANCGNCLSPITSRNGGAFSFSQLETTFTIDELPSPFTPSSFQLAYQVNDLVAAIPEPSTWAMMIGGLGIVGGVMRRRERTRTPVRLG